MPRQTVTIASIAVLLCASAWGLFWVPIRYFENLGIDGSWTVFLLNAPATIALGAAVLFTFPTQRPHLGKSLVIGLFAGLGIASYSIGLVYSEVVRTTLLFYLTPVWATFIGMYWLAERVNLYRWIAILLGLGGFVVLLAGNAGKPLNIGDLLALVSGLSWAIGASLIKYHGKIPVAGMVFFQFFFLSVFALVLGYLFGKPELPDLDVVGDALWLMATVSLLMFVPAATLVFWAQQFLFPGRVGLLMMSEVVVATVTASIFLPDERLTAIQWISCLMIIAASVVELLPALTRQKRTAGPSTSKP